MITEKDVRDAIQKMSDARAPVRRIEMSPEDYEAFRQRTVKTLPMSEANQIFAIPVKVKPEVPPGCFRVCSDSEEEES